jgi:hypothetical protein
MDRSEASALADLQMHWDEAYIIGLDGDIWSARYRSSADELRAHTSSELRELIRSDYAYRQKADLATEIPDEDEDEHEDDDDDQDDQDDQDSKDDGGADLVDAPTGSGMSGEQDDGVACGPRDDVESDNFATLHGDRMST